MQTVTFENVRNLVKQLSFADQVRLIEWVISQIRQKFIQSEASTQVAGYQLSDDILTPEQVVANIQRLPKNPANIERATESLAEGLVNSPNESDPTFDVKNWNQQWDAFEANMKAEELAHEQAEQHI